MANKEQRTFKMHPQLLFDVISRQAGSLGKGVLEGIMNSVDAGATFCEVKLDANKLSIRDDGKGFKNKGEIEKFFDTFGSPHTADENKTYGTFRMGRGQIFSFGQNSWRTGEFSMRVDIKGKGLDYDLETNAQVVKGCLIEVDLYKPLLPSDLNATIRDIEKMAKYVSINLTINGKKVSVDPATEKWDEITDDAYIRIRESTCLAVYNLGVWVKDFGNYQYGCGGTVVSRKQLTLNFARNDILVNECSIWKKVRKVVDQRATTANKRKPVLDDGERQRFADQVVAGEIDGTEARELKIFTDVTGKQWSAKMLSRCRHGEVVTSAERGNQIGDTLMQGGVCFVFADETLERFGMTSVKQLVKLINDNCNSPYWKPKVVTFAEVTKGMDSKHTVLDKKQWTPREQVFVDLLNSNYRSLLWGFMSGRSAYNDVLNTRRDILIGCSKSALAWTDGKRYIVFAREYLTRLQMDMSGLLDLFDTCLHEYCHEGADTGSHIHSHEFYQAYHDAGKGSNYASIQAFKELGATLERHGRKVNDRLLKQLDAEAKAVTASKKHRGVAGEIREDRLVAAKVVDRMPLTGTSPVAGRESSPYRITSNYGILFNLGNQKYWDRQELLEAGAKATGKDAKLVANDLAVLSNPTHSSNKNRSKVDKDNDGKIKLIKVA